MLMTKEFNNKHSDSNRMMFMGKKHLFALIKRRERAYNLSLGVEKPFSSDIFLKSSRFPIISSLIWLNLARVYLQSHNLPPLLPMEGEPIFKAIGG